VDLIVTPTRLLRVDGPRQRPDRIFWELLPDEKRDAIPLLQERAPRALRGVRGMHESSTYQVILVEGRIEETRDILLRLGRKRFGPPNEHVQTTIQAISSRERLEALSERLLDVTTWQALLADE